MVNSPGTVDDERKRARAFGEGVKVLGAVLSPISDFAKLKKKTGKT